VSPRTTMVEMRHQRVLIVEDEPVLAFALEELLVESGFEIAGVAARLETALAIIESGVCDAAILDTNLAGISVDPAASALAVRGLPFIILSGYSPDEQHGAFTGALRLQKPCRPERLIQALRSILPAQ
jgi:DNA-binding response OmpR family regulator